MSRRAVLPGTLLLVNGNPGVLADLSLILNNSGFTVLAASSPEEAVQISVQFTGPIDLLLTEVMMRGMSGPGLAKKLMVQRTQLRVMMITRYDNGELLILNYGWHMVPAMSVAKVLKEKVLALLRSPDHHPRY